ncbi:MAG: hypothetical protein KatS3mg013_1111 [Actinomycetota bacterium]|jgi:uncharacterized membrane protein (UPF0127 family)|nr:MAG: hypothetical protein KatS3mg013_1111 [Actinomycetota bacterium]
MGGPTAWQDGRVRPIATLLAATALVAPLPGCGPEPAETARATSEAVLAFATAHGPAELAVTVADSPSERTRGLAGVERLPEGEGMAFLWPEPVRARFWMKDTTIPLSVAFWDERGRIVGIVHMEPCMAEPCPIYPAPGPVVGAVEVNQGWFDRHGVRVGDAVALRDR